LAKYDAIQAYLSDHGVTLLPSNFHGIEIYFVSLPGWFVAAVLYIGLSAVYQRRVRPAMVEARPAGAEISE
jgi:hypothetical protein